MTNLPPELEAQARELAERNQITSEWSMNVLREMAQRTLEWAASLIEPSNCRCEKCKERQYWAQRLRSLAGQEER